MKANFLLKGLAVIMAGFFTIFQSQATVTVTNNTCDFMYVAIELVDANCGSVTGSATGIVPPTGLGFALTCTGTGDIGYATAGQSVRSCSFLLGSIASTVKCNGVSDPGQFGTTGCCSSSSFQISITGALTAAIN